MAIKDQVLIILKKQAFEGKSFRKEYEMLQSGKINRQQIENRKMLRGVMKKAGFYNIQTEWWHFNYDTDIPSPSYDFDIE